MASDEGIATRTGTPGNDSCEHSYGEEEWERLFGGARAALCKKHSGSNGGQGTKAGNCSVCCVYIIPEKEMQLSHDER